jgi:hypothetical protein
MIGRPAATRKIPAFGTRNDKLATFQYHSITPIAGTRSPQISLPRSGTLDELGADLGRARQRREIKFADWPNVAVSSKMLIKWRF